MRKVIELLSMGLCLMAVVSTALAQERQSHDDPGRAAALKRSEAVLNEGMAILRRARVLLRSGKYAEALTECDRAAMIFSPEVPDYPEVHEVLAECYLAQNLFPQAVKEGFAPRDCPTGSRLAMTRAMALIGVGRDDDAMALVLAEVGTVDEPGSIRKGLRLWDLPTDRGSSPSAEWATVHLIRAANKISSSDPGVRDDIEKGIKLAPRNPSAQLLMGEYLDFHLKYREAIPYLKAAQKSGSKRTMKAASDVLPQIRDLAAKAGG